MKAPGKGCLQASRAASAAGASKKKSKNGGKAEATMDGKRTERVGEGGRRTEQAGGKKGWGGWGPGRGSWRGGAGGVGWAGHDFGAHLWVHADTRTPLDLFGANFWAFQVPRCATRVRCDDTCQQYHKKQTAQTKGSEELGNTIIYFSKGFANILRNQADEGQLLFSRWA